MAINDYIIIDDGTDSYKYKTTFKSWASSPVKPMTSRVLLNSKLDVTYGSGQFPVWDGDVIAPVTSPGAGWGTITTLRAQLKKAVIYTFTDHYGTEYPVASLEGPFKEKSIQPDWEAPTNEILVSMKVMAEDV